MAAEQGYITLSPAQITAGEARVTPAAVPQIGHAHLRLETPVALGSRCKECTVTTDASELVISLPKAAQAAHVVFWTSFDS